MKYKLILTAFLFCFFSKLHSQTIVESKLFEHTVSIQVNELIRQIINLDVDNTVLTNPYLLNYSLIHNPSKFGITAGFGYDYEKITDKESPGNQESIINDINARIGVTRKFPLSPKFYLLSGLDFILKYKENNTTAVTITESNSFVDSTMNVSKSIDQGLGGGVQVRLCWDITRVITLSTEATFYFLNLSEKDHTMVATVTEFTNNPLNNSYTINTSNSNVERSEFNIIVPVSIFLGIKF